MNRRVSEERAIRDPSRKLSGRQGREPELVQPHASADQPGRNQRGVAFTWWTDGDKRTESPVAAARPTRLLLDQPQQIANLAMSLNGVP